ncbi:MAG: hypothetical protein CL610_03495 [Anaerolineaceae bacterium]|nr:hypothetical protein [Anaerolineaceae bacterium]
MRKLVILLVCVTALAAFGSVSLAQDITQTVLPDATPDTAAVDQVPLEGDEADGATLESVTADSAGFAGTEVTIEGMVVEFINARAFVLGEGAVVDDDRVIVINNGVEEFDLRLTKEQWVELTGTVYLSLEAGGFDSIVSNGIAMPDAIMPEATIEAMPETDVTPVDDMTTPEMTEEAAMDMDMEATADVLPETDVTPVADGATTEMTEEAAMDMDMEATADVLPETDATPVADGAMAEMTEEAGMEMTAEATVEAMPETDATPVDTMEPTPLPVEPVQPVMTSNVDLGTMRDIIAELYPNYTIIEVTSPSDITLITQE